MECGIQVSSFRPVLKTAQQVEMAFARLKGMGCRTVQLQWIDPEVPIPDIRKAMERQELRSVSVQEIYEDFRKDPEYFIRLNRETGGTILCVSRIPQDRMDPEGLSRFTGELSRLSVRLKNEGMRLCFHPVRADYRLIGGTAAFELLLRELPEMELCLDLRHCFLSGRSLPGMLRKYEGRVRMVHFKDGVLCADGSDRLCPLGEGDTDWTGAVRACMETGVTYLFAEQEQWEGDPFDALQKSLEWLQRETSVLYPGT